MTSKFDDTIAAISTPIGEGGISVLRLSGPESFSIASKIFRPKKEVDLRTLPSHTIHLGEIYNTDGAVVDQVVVSLFKSPNSYTSEDVIEINSHGGIGISKIILDLLIQNGARHAEPGEFTKRAFINGRIDLPQAEAVLDLIKAKSEQSIEVAARQLTGHLSSSFKNLKNDLMKLYAHLEAYLDFPDEHLEIYTNQEFADQFQNGEEALEQLIRSFDRGSLIREGLKVVLVGRANVGKSSLFNALLERDHALVSEHPGTTRDHLEEAISIDGIALRLTDTAGLGLKSDHPLDQMGMERTRQALNQAGIYLFVVDGSEPISEIDQNVFEEMQKNKPKVILVNKSDLEQKIDLDLLKKITGSENFIFISSKTRKGFEELEKMISKITFLNKPNQEGEQVTRLRHKHALESSLKSLRQARDSFEKKQSLELVTLDLKLSLDSLRELIGEVYSEDLLDVIFSEFCIGK